jgi:hypothetical protein
MDDKIDNVIEANIEHFEVLSSITPEGEKRSYDYEVVVENYGEAPTKWVTVVVCEEYIEIEHGTRGSSYIRDGNTQYTSTKYTTTNTHRYSYVHKMGKSIPPKKRYREVVNRNWDRVLFDEKKRISKPYVHSIMGEDTKGKKFHYVYDNETNFVNGQWFDTKTATSSCVVATCIYKGENEPEVVYLRHLRDAYLSKTKLGRRFIAAYYRNGNELVAFFEKSYLLRVTAKTILSGFLALSRALKF